MDTKIFLLHYRLGMQNRFWEIHFSRSTVGLDLIIVNTIRV
jgi:hypothetical protein